MLVVVLAAAGGSMGVPQTAPTTGPLTSGRHRILIRSTRDDSLQPSYVIVPPRYDQDATPLPLVVSLHTWHGDLEQRLPEFESETTKRGWLYLFPHFRGIDDHPEACGSDIAQSDILDAVEWARRNLKVDAGRIYLVGWSGGGHMALLMAARAPDLWTAVSAWAGITDMAAYYRERAADQPPQEAGELRACMGGAPGTSTAVDSQYRNRSPLTSLARAAKVPIDIWAGNDDTDVSPSHALLAFNTLAAATGSSPISADEIAQLTQPHGHLARPQPGDQVTESSLGHPIFLRRTAGPSRVTIYEAGHATFAGPTFDWFEKHTKQ